MKPKPRCRWARQRWGGKTKGGAALRLHTVGQQVQEASARDVYHLYELLYRYIYVPMSGAAAKIKKRYAGNCQVWYLYEVEDVRVYWCDNCPAVSNQNDISNGAQDSGGWPHTTLEPLHPRPALFPSTRKG